MSRDAGNSRRSQKLFVLLVSVALLGALAWLVRPHHSLEQLVEQELRIREYIALNPWKSFLAGLAVYLGLSFIPGTGGKAVIFGWLYGYWQAVVIVIFSLTAAAMAIFSLSRYLFRERVERRYERFLALLNKHLVKEGAFYLLTLRMAHFPYSLINPVSGASRIRTWTFFWTTVVGLLPGTAVWVYVGVSLPSLRKLSDEGVGALLDPPLLVALFCTALLPLLFRWFISRFGIPGAGNHDHDATGLEKTQPPTDL